MPTPPIMIERALRRFLSPVDSTLMWISLGVLALGMITLYSATNENPGRVAAQFANIGVALGVMWIVRAPQVWGAFDPRHGVAFFQANGAMGFAVLGSVFLAVTGGEALYADMGHFGRAPIRLAWFSLVLPALFLFRRVAAPESQGSS